jgi:type I restriction enzyme S subunit
MKLIKNKESWKRVRLDDVVIRREENDRENARERFDTFVKVEHMEAESLHLQGLGSQKAEELPPTFYKIFRKGQILFPTRNPHLRRTALAPCDGICGEKTLTLEVNEKVADSQLIPFLFHSASFYDHSAGAIIGSTNPHCRWRDIANYEFLLPPKDQQAKLAELLWAADASQQQSSTLVAKLITQLRSTREHLISDSADAVLPLEELCKKKISYGIVQAGPHVEDGLPYIKSSDMKEDGIDPKALQRTTPAIYAKYARSEVVPGELVFSLRGNLGEVQRVPEGLERANLTQGTARLSPNDQVSADYLMAAVRSERVQRMVTALSKGSTFKEISLADLRRVKVPIHRTKSTQAAVCESIATVAFALRGAKENQVTSASLLRSLTNQIF